MTTNTTHAKRFNAQRAARRALQAPKAAEGADFVTAKNADGSWSFTIPASSPALANHPTAKANAASWPKGPIRRKKGAKPAAAALAFATIRDVIAHRFVGNYRDDSDAFGAIERFQKKASATDRKLAERHMSLAGMGVPDPHPRLKQKYDRIAATTKKAAHLKVVGGTDANAAGNRTRKPKAGRKIKPKGQEAAFTGRHKDTATNAAQGILPPIPDFSAETHRPHRKKLTEVVSMVERGALDELMALKINPTSTSPKAIQRYQNFAIQALKVQRADGRPATQMKPEEWEAKLIREATAFTATKSLGRGSYDTREGFTTAEQAERAALEMGNRSMVYAVTPQGRSVLVGGVQGGAFERTKSAQAVLGNKAA